MNIDIFILNTLNNEKLSMFQDINIQSLPLVLFHRLNRHDIVPSAIVTIRKPEELSD